VFHRPSAARSLSTGVCCAQLQYRSCGEMVSRTTTASQGILCLSVYGLVYGTFAMSAVVPVVWLPWTGFALQPPFALCLRLLLLYPARLWIRGAWDQTVPPSSLCVVPCSRMAHPKKRTISASILLASYFWPSWFRSGLLVLIGVVQTVLTRCPPPGQGGRILRKDTVGAAAEVV